MEEIQTPAHEEAQIWLEMHTLSRLTGVGSLRSYQEDHDRPSSVLRREIPEDNAILSICISLPSWTLNALYVKYNLHG